MDDRCIYGLELLPVSARGCVLTVGNFDGVHLGHQQILQTARLLADAEKLPAVAMTFEPPPDLALRPQDTPQRITPLAEKQRLLLEGGCDFVVIVAADHKLLSMQPIEFIEEILLERLSPSHIVEGENFFFGKERSGSTETLKRVAAGRFSLHVVDLVTVELPAGRWRISSSLVRRLVEAGSLQETRLCLGRDFALFGRVIKGTGCGEKMLGFPTINMDAGQQVTPSDGVYAGWGQIAGEKYVAAISIGCKATLANSAGQARSIEAYLVEATGDFYGADVSLQFVRRIRQQRKFDSAEALKAAITEDVRCVREFLERR